MVNSTHRGLTALVSVRRACQLVGVSKSTFYRVATIDAPEVARERAVREPSNKLGPDERRGVLDLLHRTHYVDASVDHVWASALDQGIYLCSRATMHRILDEVDETGDRRGQRTHPAKKIPVLVSSGPNEVWNWDIERHEALLNREGVQDPLRQSVAAGW